MAMNNEVVKQLPNVDNGLHDVNNTIVNNPDNKKRNRGLDTCALVLIKNMILLREFIENPGQIAADITKIHGDLPYSKDFIEITKAVNCEYTRTQGVEIGKAKIIEYIRKVADEVKTKYKDTRALVQPNIDAITKLLEVIENTIDPYMLQRRFDQSSDGEELLKYMNGLIDKIFVPESVEVSPTFSLSSFLKTLENVYNKSYGELTNMVLSNLETIQKDLEAKLAYIEVNDKYITNNQFNKTKIQYGDIEGALVRLGTDDKEAYYKEYLNNNKADEINDLDKLTLIKDVITRTTKIKEDLITVLTAIKQKHEDIAGIEIGIPAYIEKMISSTVGPMENMTITTNEYTILTNNYSITLHNLLNIYDRLDCNLELTAKAVDNIFYITNRIYGLLNKLSLKTVK